MYIHTPYLFRNNLVDNHLEINTSFNWRNQFPIRWVSFFSFALVSSKKTKVPVFYYFENSGAHGNHSSQTYPKGGSLNSISDAKEILYHQITYNTRMLNDLIRILKKQNIYDSTKIILAADHGIYTPYLDSVLPYLQQISTPNMGVFYNPKLQEKVLNPHYLPVMLMVKDFNTIQIGMQQDSRFLSLGDLHGIIMNTFTNNYIEPDYTKTLPPKRVFNIPYIQWEFLYYLAGKNNYYDTNNYITNNKLAFLKVKSIINGDFEISSYDFDSIEDLPPVEILE